jgi:methionine synthase I (cobalamin-dependent)
MQIANITLDFSVSCPAFYDMSVTVLDGGMGHLIKQWGVKIHGLAHEQQFLAGLLANEADPGTVIKGHSAYIQAGCHCITTNNFVATQHNLAKVGRESDALRLVQVIGHLLTL